MIGNMRRGIYVSFPRLQVNAKSMEKEEPAPARIKKEPIWWMSWEFYLIVLLAVGLRLYRIDTAQYMTDHNTFYQMAHDAVANGLWPISGNRSSTGPLISTSVCIYNDDSCCYFVQSRGRQYFYCALQYCSGIIDIHFCATLLWTACRYNLGFIICYSGQCDYLQPRYLAA